MSVDMYTFGYDREGCERVPIPVGVICAHCDEPIRAFDTGVWMFGIRGFNPAEGQYYMPLHEPCLLRGILGSAEHQRRMKRGLPCNEDCHPKLGLTARQDALLAYYESQGIRVHILEHGFSLCRFSSALPGSWPPGNRWARVDEPQLSNCDECKEVLAKRVS